MRVSRRKLQSFNSCCPQLEPHSPVSQEAAAEGSPKLGPLRWTLGWALGADDLAGPGLFQASLLLVLLLLCLSRRHLDPEIVGPCRVRIDLKSNDIDTNCIDYIPNGAGGLPRRLALGFTL